MKSFISLTTLALPLIAMALASCSRSPDAGHASAAEKSDRKPPSNAAALATCTSYSELAREIMAGRQAGVKMSKQMAVNVDAAGNSDPVMEQLIISAYDQPRMSLEENQQELATNFENDTYLACVKELNRAG